MKAKLKLLAFFVMACSMAHAQFFESLKKPKASVPRYVSINDSTPGKARFVAVSSEASVTVKNEFRPVANIFSTGIQINHKNPNTQPGVLALTGAGISYQHLVWNPGTEKWNSTWSVNALAWYSRSITGEQSKAVLYGATLGLFDNKVMGGMATDGQQWLITVGFGIPLNNL